MSSLYLQMETNNIDSVIGDPTLRRLVVTEERRAWNGIYPSFFSNEVNTIHCLAYSFTYRVDCLLLCRMLTNNIINYKSYPC